MHSDKKGKKKSNIKLNGEVLEDKSLFALKCDIIVRFGALYLIYHTWQSMVFLYWINDKNKAWCDYKWVKYMYMEHNRYSLYTSPGSIAVI